MNKTLKLTAKICESACKGNMMITITATITFLTAFFGLLLGIPEVSDACTSFAVFSKSIYFGMNFDFLDPTMKFLISTKGGLT